MRGSKSLTCLATTEKNQSHNHNRYLLLGGHGLSLVSMKTAPQQVMAGSIIAREQGSRSKMKFSSESLGLALGGVFLGILIGRCMTRRSAEDEEDEFSIPDQPARYAAAVKRQNMRVLDIDLMYDASYARNKIVLVTGGNRGIGRTIAEEYVRQGARVIITSRAAFTLPGAQVIDGIEMQSDSCGEQVAAVLAKAGIKVDILINNAGYFYEPVETLTSLNYEEEMKMIDICAIGPLRITSALVKAGLLGHQAKVIIISSQGGSIAWRLTQNPAGHDYGHHMSKAAANMAGVLMAQELQGQGIAVALLHPGFNKTDMTSKYQSIWEIEGAVSPAVGAKRVVHEVGKVSLATTGAFINCEDGKRIPW